MRYLTIFSTLVGCISCANGLAAKDGDGIADEISKEVFEIVVDENYKKPIFRRTPRKDADGNRPLDVVKQFLADVNVGDFEKAQKLTLLGNLDVGPGIKPYESVGEHFPALCKNIRDYTKKITVSGSTINDKSIYWRIEFKVEDDKQRESTGNFELIRHEGRWRILEKPHWSDVAGKTDRQKWTPGW